MTKADREVRLQFRRLAILFATMYFAQGIGEPTEGLIAQPVRSLLSGWGYSASWIGISSAWISLPWTLKPLYGLLTDFVPCFGTRRRSYLLCMSFIAAVVPWLFFVFPPTASYAPLFVAALFFPCLAIAFCDVVVDALMVERGQSHGWTGKFQSIQWTASYVATVGTGLAGGWLSTQDLHRWSFLISGTAAAITFVMTYLWVVEPRSGAQPHRLQDAVGHLASTFADRRIWAIAAFLFLWNFNPFSTAVQHQYMTRTLGFSEQFYGVTNSVLAVGAIVGSLLYGGYCQRVPFRKLIHVAIATGVTCTLAYVGLTRHPSLALGISFFVGLTYMTANLIQFDLAARICHVETAGTTFAILMAVSNLSIVLSAALGGIAFDRVAVGNGPVEAFRWLVVVGSGLTACCWFLVPWLRERAR